ncbi:hypothetical protein BDN70DRAFT_874134 [Pholiota conissans]|uniref:Uncharacterized protein n=1 Tax=Pholiota conissans TaxID=109636 RepID=A0A9P5Z886_9AGAR|nr:hypothetical protein BDN70DRAFT_874134 [Pholiota conissans]
MRVILRAMLMVLDTATRGQGNNVTYDVQKAGPRGFFEAMGLSFISEYDATPNFASL